MLQPELSDLAGPSDLAGLSDLAAAGWGVALDSFAAAAPRGRIDKTSSGVRVMTTGAPIPVVNGIFAPARNPDPGELVDLVATYAAGLPWSIQVRGVADPEIVRAAAARGLTRQLQLPLMLCDLTQPDGPVFGAPRPGGRVADGRVADGRMAGGSATSGPVPVDDARVRAVSGADEEIYGQTLAAGKEVGRDVFRIFTRPAMLDAENLRGYLAESDGAGVATALTVQIDELIGIFNVATVPAHRRRGFAAAVTRVALGDGYRGGARTAFLHATPAAEGLYTALGFVVTEHWSIFVAPS